MARNLLLKIFIFALLWVVGAMFFGSQFGGAAGTTTSMVFIGQSIMGSDLSDDAGSVTGLILSFIITAVVYYIVAELLTLALMRLFASKR